jgi:hypothetical protein
LIGALMVTAGNEASFKIDNAYVAIDWSNTTYLVRRLRSSCLDSW